MPVVKLSIPPFVTIEITDKEIESFRKILGKRLKVGNKDFLGYYHIISKKSGKCLDTSGWDKDDGANIHQYTLHGGDNQRWMLVKAKDDSFYIFAKHSGKCLDVVGWGIEDGTRIQQYSFHGGENQEWLLEEADDGYFYIIARHSKKCLDVDGARLEDGASIHQWTLHGGDNQKWKLQPAE